MKSFRPKDGSGEPPGPERNVEHEFLGENCSNEAHASVTNPDARLFEEASWRVLVLAARVLNGEPQRAGDSDRNDPGDWYRRARGGRRHDRGTCRQGTASTSAWPGKACDDATLGTSLLNMPLLSDDHRASARYRLFSFSCEDFVVWSRRVRCDAASRIFKIYALMTPSCRWTSGLDLECHAQSEIGGSNVF